MPWALDTSSVIYAWDNYPIAQFPPLWTWLGDQMRQQNLVLSDVALGETEKNEPACAQWLKNQPISVRATTQAVLQQAGDFATSLGIKNDKFHPDGVGANDLIIIASARLYGDTLLSEEGRQQNRPQNLAKYKIPAVCEMPSVKVHQQTFIEYIKASSAVFAG
jgi:Domain of unknown function (DUF4411)